MGPPKFPPWEGAILRGKGVSHCKVYGHSAVICAKTAEPMEMPFGLCLLWAWMVPRNHVLDGGPDPLWEGAILRERGTQCKVQGHSADTCRVKTAEPIEMLF